MILKVIFINTLRYIVPYTPHWILMFLGDISGWLDSLGTKAAIIKDGLQLLDPEKNNKEIEKITYQSLANFHKDLFEIWSFPRLTQKKIARVTYFEGTEYLDAALAQGNGVIIGVTHFGSWKILIPALAYAGYDVMQIAVDPRSFIRPDAGYVNNKVMEIEYQCEKSLPVKFLYINEYMRDMYRHLKNNGVLIMSFDGMERRQEERFTVGEMTFGLDTTPIKLSQRINVPLLPLFAIREKDNRHRLVIHPQLKVEKDVSVEVQFQEYVTYLKNYILRYPSHYARSLYVFATKWADKVEVNS